MDWLIALVALGAVLALTAWAGRRRERPAFPDTPEEFLAVASAADAGPGELFGESPGVRFPGPRARAWAYGVLNEAGVDADADPAYAAGLLMQARPALGRVHADALIRAML